MGGRGRNPRDQQQCEHDDPERSFVQSAAEVQSKPGVPKADAGTPIQNKRSVSGVTTPVPPNQIIVIAKTATTTG